LELKVQQQLQGGLRSRTPDGIYYEVAGHILYYLLLRWVMVEAAQQAKVSPLRLSFTAALREINEQWPSAVVASEAWLEQTLRPRLLVRLASHQVEQRPGRTAPRGEKARRVSKRAKDAKRAKGQGGQGGGEEEDQATPLVWPRLGPGWPESEPCRFSGRLLRPTFRKTHSGVTNHGPTRPYGKHLSQQKGRTQ
jgi:hypothetical protein